MGAVEQRQYPRFGFGLPVTLVFSDPGQEIAGELQDLSLGGCFAVLFDASSDGINEIIRDISPLNQEQRAEFLGALLKPEIRIY